jgi:hypothetical protein
VTAANDSSIATLVHSLRGLASVTSDEGARSAALHFAGLLEIAQCDQGENLVRQIRDQLNSPKTDFTDSSDDRAQFRAARSSAYRAAQAAVNYYVELRRPDLAVLKRRRDEA